jgi:hypothetical protein
MRANIELTGDERRALEALLERELERMRQGATGWVFHREYLASVLAKVRQADTILSGKLGEGARGSDI